MAKSGLLRVSKVLTTDSASDIGTKYLPVLLHQQHTDGLGVFSEQAIFPEVQMLHMLTGPDDQESPQYHSSSSDEEFLREMNLQREERMI